MLRKRQRFVSSKAFSSWHLQVERCIRANAQARIVGLVEKISTLSAPDRWLSPGSGQTLPLPRHPSSRNSAALIPITTLSPSPAARRTILFLDASLDD
eukprot:3731265-Rhodomonas_salina.1